MDSTPRKSELIVDIRQPECLPGYDEVGDVGGPDERLVGPPLDVAKPAADGMHGHNAGTDLVADDNRLTDAVPNGRDGCVDQLGDGGVVSFRHEVGYPKCHTVDNEGVSLGRRTQCSLEIDGRLDHLPVRGPVPTVFLDPARHLLVVGPGSGNENHRSPYPLGERRRQR